MDDNEAREVGAWKGEGDPPVGSLALSKDNRPYVKTAAGWRVLSTTDVEDLLEEVEDYARLAYDGHITILRFTTHWKGCYRTETDREIIDQLPPFESLHQLLLWLAGHIEAEEDKESDPTYQETDNDKETT